MIAKEPRDSRSDLVPMREDGRVLATLNREQFHPGDMRDE